MPPKWDDLILRIRQEIDYQLRNNSQNKDQGIVRVTVVLLADTTGPVVWELEGKKIEPTSRAKALLGLLNQ